MVAYFCLEYALSGRLPLYAGGLGVLAGDLILGASEENFPMTFLGLLYSSGVHEPRLLGKGPEATTFDLLAGEGFSILKGSSGEAVKVRAEVADHEVVIQVWEKTCGRCRLFLLDPDVSENSPSDREICKYLYDANPLTMLKQELILGLGGVRLLRLLGQKVDIYHLNEGHTATVLLELLREKVDAEGRSPQKSLSDFLNEIGKSVVATKHTIFAGAGLHLSSSQVGEGLSLFLRKYGFGLDEIFDLGTHFSHPDDFSTTNFLLRYVGKANGVSKSHVYFEKQAHPESRLLPITNGVSLSRWQSEAIKGQEGEKALWSAHLGLKKELVARVARGTGVTLDPSKLTVVWARRLVSYKRPGLLFNDLTALSGLVNNPSRPVQFILAGRTTLTDQEMADVASTIQEAVSSPEFSGKIVFWPDYDLDLAMLLTSGADVWLNTPKVGFEACGTSGMKAGLNGALPLSVSDGWYAEIDWSGVGWVLPADSANQDIYRILETGIAPLYYQRDRSDIPADWVGRMRKVMEVVSGNYTISRVLRDYKEQLYGLSS